ncbi:unnamed protein product [Staurois parvus]|uniref:Uncharacterized protein n=1 Tax=Staurois parvus TaxID=386267 RepID=A0ABN9HH25_9NEOB|nr:unnamed protein product [Staurois parvus]
MPKHNFAPLTCVVSKTVHIITTTLYIQVNHTLFFSGQTGLHLVVNGNEYLLIFFVYYQRKTGPK